MSRLNWCIETFSQMTLEEKSYIIQIISPIFVILTIIVTILIYIGQKNKDRKENSVTTGQDLERLAEYMAYIFMVVEMENKDTYMLAKSTNPFDIKEFTYEEMNRIYTQEQIEQLNDIFRPNENYDNISLNTLRIARDRFYYLFNASMEIINGENLHTALCHEFYRTLFSTMNKWTTLCIAMTEGVTLEKLLFKCMGGNFVEFITIAYAFIANLNKDVDPATKKMKFIATIYNKWKWKLRKYEIKQIIKYKLHNLIKSFIVGKKRNSNTK